jgi:hypothetical protein
MLIEIPHVALPYALCKLIFKGFIYLYVYLKAHSLKCFINVN